MSLTGCSVSYNSSTLRLPENEDNPFAEAVINNEWAKVLSLAKNRSDPFIQLIALRALYELKHYEQIEKEFLIKEPRFYSYGLFIKALSLFETERWKDLKNFSIPDDLPFALQERLLSMQGEAAQQTMELDRAIIIYETFLKKYSQSSLRADILARLADLYFSSGDEEKALELYEELYRSFPFGRHDSAARAKLLEAGRFERIDMDAHLNRVSAFRKQARFSKAYKEIDHLLKSATPDVRARLLLSKAQIYFADKRYANAEKLARTTLKKTLPLDLDLEWRQIHAASLIRIGKYPEGAAVYRTILGLKISKSLRESILYRLGMLALDQELFDEAAKSFLQIRALKIDGAYNESSRWFGAWASIQAHRSEASAPQNSEKLLSATKLLDELEDRLTSPILSSQTLYWRSKVEHLKGRSDEAQEYRNKLLSEWPMSLYSLLTMPSMPTHFLKPLSKRSQTTPTSPPGKSDTDIGDMAETLSWQRLELFRAVRFNSWAQMELDSFLSSYRQGTASVRLAVAERLYQLGDWASLVVWADRYFKQSLQKANASEPSLRYHYPKAYEPLVLKAAQEFNVSPFLIWGVMREESRFRPDVISAAGAVGLLQLMPFRAQKIAKVLGERASPLSEPRRNIRLAAYHLREIALSVDTYPVDDSFKPILQIATYNAGPEPVRRWIRERNTNELDVFIESIPYTETRNYVKRVMQSAYIYYRLYGAESTHHITSNRETTREKI